MMNFKNEEAVSPVIGVILMVAITVILAAVIAAFVFGMTGNVETTKTVHISSKLAGDAIVLTISGGPDLATLNQLTITIEGVAPTGSITCTGGIVDSATSEGVIKPGDDKKFKVGDTITIKPAGNNDLTGRLLVVGKWSDGAEQIIIDHTY